MIGEHIGNFQIVSQLGSGGMGDVFLAEQTEIHTKVAIKLLHANISTDRTHIQRFFNEAVAVSKIKHAGIVRIFDVGFAPSGRAYLIMEYLEGETLSDRIAHAGRLSIADVADIGRQTAGVLAATHAEGVVHRDLKPDNIYLVRDAEMARGERVKVLDFGIAKLSNTNLTGSANSMGTPTYMAPEQWNHSGGVDWRADMYSLGCLAFEMVCGRPPFVATSIGEACAMHLSDIPPLARTFAPECPPALEALFARMLAKKPEDRPASMAEVAAGFSAHADTPTGPMYAVGTPTSYHGAALAQTVATGGGSHAGLPAHASPPAVAADTAPKQPGRRVLYGLGALVLVGGAAGAVVVATRGAGHGGTEPPKKPAVATAKDAGTPTPSDAVALAPSDAGTGSAARAPVMPNYLVDITPPARPVVLGVDSDAAPEAERGFRPAAKILAPTVAYQIQAHEVSWSELEPFMAARGQPITFPPWATDPAARARLPATNVSWQVAHDYCISLKGELPTDEEWEYAARGPERRPNSWGPARLDRMLTHALAGDAGSPVEVMKSEQDRSPTQPGDRHVFDMTGNVQEWTEGLWRPDKPGDDDSWVEVGDTTYRAIRGLPLRGVSTTKIQPDGAAYREPACATGPCNGKLEVPLEVIGFRCVVTAHSQRTVTQTASGPARPRPVDAGVAPADATVVAVTPADAAVAPPPPVDCTFDSCQASGMEGACCARKFPKPPPPPLPDKPSQEKAREAFGALAPKIRDCATKSRVHGQHRVTLTIDPAGHITSAQVGTPNAEFRACVQGTIRGISLGPSRNGGQVSSTFRFGADGSKE